ncbi:MAG: hypothetical protein ACLPWF_17115 [Bryobacteraceae bacterium]
MQQALHIFKKDVRYLRYEVALVLLIALAFAAMHATHERNNSSWGELALVVMSAFLIGRLVLAEAIPGDRQFWITRPYRWLSLLGAKLLFILTFVNLPILLAQLFIVTMDGFPIGSSLPGLVWSQVLLLTFALLPFAALATLNSGMTPFIFSQIAILAVVFGPWEMRRQLDVAQLGGVEWVRDSIAGLALAAVVSPIIYVQYKSRRTVFSRWVGLGGIAIAALIYAELPTTLALALQTHLSKEPAAASSIQISLGDSSGPLWYRRQPKIALRIPIVVQGLAEGAEIEPDALKLSLHSEDGRSANLNINDCSELKRDTLSANAVRISAMCMADPTFFHLENGKPVTFRGSLYLTLFGNARSETIPLSDQPANALDGLQCYTDVVRAEWDVYCRSAFRWPARLISAKLRHTNANSFTQTVSYSPFPASLSIEPVETRWASAYAAGPPPTEPVRDVTIIVEEPLAHFRRDFEAQGVPLNEFTFPSFHYLHPEKATVH